VRRPFRPLRRGRGLLILLAMVSGSALQAHEEPSCCGPEYTHLPFLGPPWYPKFLGSYWTTVWADGTPPDPAKWGVRPDHYGVPTFCQPGWTYEIVIHGQLFEDNLFTGDDYDLCVRYNNPNPPSVILSGYYPARQKARSWSPSEGIEEINGYDTETAMLQVTPGTDDHTDTEVTLTVSESPSEPCDVAEGAVSVNSDSQTVTFYRGPYFGTAHNSYNEIYFSAFEDDILPAAPGPWGVWAPEQTLGERFPVRRGISHLPAAYSAGGWHWTLTGPGYLLSDTLGWPRCNFTWTDYRGGGHGLQPYCPIHPVASVGFFAHYDAMPFDGSDGTENDDPDATRNRITGVMDYQAIDWEYSTSYLSHPDYPPHPFDPSHPDSYPAPGYVEIWARTLGMYWDFHTAVLRYDEQPDGTWYPVFNEDPCTISFTVMAHGLCSTVPANYHWGNDGIQDCPVWVEVACPP
jgi:hypothetical protein